MLDERPRAAIRHNRIKRYYILYNRRTRHGFRLIIGHCDVVGGYYRRDTARRYPYGKNINMYIPTTTAGIRRYTKYGSGFELRIVILLSTVRNTPREVL